ncbi:hypothetical protein ACCO45_010850 [Purpureocillium lilacinum]|uniref:Uncharacterized protein n=1 Tax=Purpureocillium lilacinum TaxID=33203 RepID=A0ACC4DGM0_PURLI
MVRSACTPLTAVGGFETGHLQKQIDVWQRQRASEYEKYLYLGMGEKVAWSGSKIAARRMEALSPGAPELHLPRVEHCPWSGRTVERCASPLLARCPVASVPQTIPVQSHNLSTPPGRVLDNPERQHRPVPSSPATPSNTAEAPPRGHTSTGTCSQHNMASHPPTKTPNSTAVIFPTESPPLPAQPWSARGPLHPLQRRLFTLSRSHSFARPLQFRGSIPSLASPGAFLFPLPTPSVYVKTSPPDSPCKIAIRSVSAQHLSLDTHCAL